MNPQTAHPDLDRLAAFSLGLLDGMNAEEVAAHLRACGECELRVDAVPDDTFISLLRNAAVHPTNDSDVSFDERETRSSSPAESDPPHEIPLELASHPHYRNLQWLGAGGMGTVYKAEHRLMDRAVALKVIDRKMIDRPEILDRFLREVKALARLSHPNIVTALNAEQVGPMHLLVMEFVPGTTLARIVENEGPLPVPLACEYVRQTARGLQHAHEAGLVHRDLKPQNLMLSQTGEIKILDFGLARILSESGAIDSLTHVGTIMGTPDYVAPEQTRDARAADIRADIYSLGCTLYFFLTGQPPFPDGDAMDKLHAHREKTPRLLKDFRRDLPPRLIEIVDRTMAKDPAERCQTPAEVIRELEPFCLSKQAVPNQPVKRRRWGVPAAAGLLAASFLASVLVVSYRLPPFFSATTETGAHSSAPQGMEGPSAGIPTEPAELGKRVQQVLGTHCYRCHGQDGAIEGGFNYVMDRQRLIDSKKVVPGKPLESKLLLRVADGEMAPDEVQRRPSAEEMAVLTQWVESGATDFGPARPTRQPIIIARLPQIIREDLAHIPERDRRSIRYFTLTHLYNAGLGDDELQTYRQALSKLVNSLSWGLEIMLPYPVDPAGTVLRIDLRDYQWSPKVWERILAECPYGSVSDTEAARAISADTDCRLPYVRADWFTAFASRPPLYYEILDLPATVERLEKDLLKVKADENISAERVVRAGFNNSGISRNNRVIERHNSSYGAYWKSYDFSSSVRAKHIFSHPLGPIGAKDPFQHDGGEMIFDLPNKLHAYFLANGQGKRIDQGPIAIVSDPKRPERAVVAGLSCMSCHQRGLNDKIDQVRDHVEKNASAFPKEEADTILALYPPRQRFERVLRADNDHYRKALEKTGVRWGVTDPIRSLTERFEADLNLKLAAAEVGVSPQELLAAIANSPSLGRALGTLRSEGGSLPRALFADSYADLVRTLHLGDPFRPSAEQQLTTALTERVAVDLPEPFDSVRTGGGGRFLIFYFKNARKLSVFDVLQAKFVKDIEAADDVHFAAGRDKLLVVLAGQKVIQRWNLHTFEREKTAEAPDEKPVLLALMGSDSPGPLALWTGDTVIFMDVDKMAPIEIDGKVHQGTTQWGFQMRVSADGKTFVAWTPGISGQQYAVMRVAGNKSTFSASPDAFSFNGHWAQPNPDASLIFRFDNRIYSEDLKAYSTDWLKGWVLMPAEDPRFFLAYRESEVAICTSSDRRPVFAVKDIAAKGMNGSIINTEWGYHRGEPRIHYLPAAHLLVFLRADNKQIVVRPFNLIQALEQDGQEFLFVVSQPKTHARAENGYTYQIDVKSKSSGVTFKLEKGPEGMTVSNHGEVRWNVPANQLGKTVNVILSIRNGAGKEVFHSFEIAVE